MIDPLPAVVPELRRIEQIFSNAAAPAFFLGAVAAFVSLMTTRLGVVNERIRAIRAGAASGPSASEGDLRHLAHRARYLHDGILLTLCAGICSTLLLSILFVSQFFNFSHAYGSAALFFAATLFLVGGLGRFGQEALHARHELDDIDPRR